MQFEDNELSSLEEVHCDECGQFIGKYPVIDLASLDYLCSKCKEGLPTLEPFADDQTNDEINRNSGESR